MGRNHKDGLFSPGIIKLHVQVYMYMYIRILSAIYLIMVHLKYYLVLDCVTIATKFLLPIGVSATGGFSHITRSTLPMKTILRCSVY